MATKKGRRAKAIKAKKKRRYLKFIFLSLIILVGMVFIVIFINSVMDYLYTPGSGKGGIPTSQNAFKATLYFADSNERFLVPEIRYIPKEKDVGHQVEQIVRALIGGSNSKLTETFPRNTTLKGVTVLADGT